MKCLEMKAPVARSTARSALFADSWREERGASTNASSELPRQSRPGPIHTEMCHTSRAQADFKIANLTWTFPSHYSAQVWAPFSEVRAAESQAPRDSWAQTSRELEARFPSACIRCMLAAQGSQIRLWGSSPTGPKPCWGLVSGGNRLPQSCDSGRNTPVS